MLLLLAMILRVDAIYMSKTNRKRSDNFNNKYLDKFKRNAHLIL